MGYMIKQALLDWLDVSIEGVPCKHVSIDLIREKIQSGAFDTNNHLREVLKSLPDKIMDIQRFADTEELNFPMENPTTEEQEEWLDTFIERMKEHVQGVIEDELEALSSTNTSVTEPKECPDCGYALKKWIHASYACTNTSCGWSGVPVTEPSVDRVRELQKALEWANRIIGSGLDIGAPLRYDPMKWLQTYHSEWKEETKDD